MQKRLISWILALCMAVSFLLLPAEAADSNETRIYSFLRTELGCNEAVACGILANIEAESGFNPNAHTSYYYGICQWGSDRLTALKNYSGDDYTTLDGQLRYLQHELKTNEAKAWAHMQNIPNTAEGAYTAAWNWAQYFERCSSSHYASRGSSAQQKYWPKYHGAAVPTPAPTAKPTPTPTAKPTATPAPTPKPTPTPTVAGFTDVTVGTYYADAVKWAVEKGVTQGTTKTTFSPGAQCTRAQMVTFLWRAKGSPDPKSQTNHFTDVSQSQYYFKAVLWAVEQGITQGTGKTTFAPNDIVSRSQTVTFLWRLAGSPESSASTFTDVPLGQYYAPAVAWAVVNGVTEGTSPTTFSPKAPCTRGQIVTFLYRDMR